MTPHLAFRHALMAVAGLVLSLPAQEALAASDTLVSEQGKLIKAAQAVGKLGDDLFGDKVNIYTGGLEFVQEDVSIPGNSKLPVAAGRRLVISGRGIESQGLFANWDLEIPHIHGMLSQQYGWQGVAPGNVPSTSRCTYFGAPPAVYRTGSSSTHFRPTEYWSGHMLYIPGIGDQEMLLRNAAVNSNIPADGAGTPIVTKALWAIRCLGSLASSVGAVPANEGGEGFLAISPEGTKYRFDWLVSRPVSRIYKSVPQALGLAPADANGGDEAASVDPDVDQDSIGQNTFGISRREVLLLPTLVTDRHGNTVQYTYDPNAKWKLLSIQSADGSGNPARKITFTYVSGTNRVESVSDGTRTWHYTYAAGPQTLVILDKVTLPDNSSWKLAGLDGGSGQPGIVTLHLDYLGGDTASQECDSQPEGLNSPVATGTMVHPSGATGSFTMTPTQHGRNGVPATCFSDGVPDSPGYPYYPQFYDTYAITAKTISGPGLDSMTWRSEYQTFNPGRPQCLDCLNVVTVTEPEGNQQRYTFGSTFAVNEGMLLKQEVIRDGVVLRSTSTRYEAGFTQLIGFSGQDRGDAKMRQQMKPVNRKTIHQQGVDFTWQVPTIQDFDRYYRPTRVTRSSTLGHARSEAISYHDNTAKWVLGQIAAVRELGTQKLMEANGYNATSANLESVRRFGKLLKVMTYNADGTLASEKDEKNPATRFSNYKRGIARRVDLPDGRVRSLSVTDIGKVSAYTDENGFATTFNFDAMGRVSRINYPTSDSVAWAPTDIRFEQIGSSEYDVAGGHWRQVITTGNQQISTTFDALWRPRYVRKVDLTRAATTSSLIANYFDSDSNVTFTSNPRRAYAQYPEGTWFGYDALGRLSLVIKHTELGDLQERYQFQDGFTTRHIDFKNNASVTSYQAFDQPVTTAISKIALPESVVTTIKRNVFGNPTSITRAGGGKSATRTYVYDANERLCKTIEPEIGATVQAYDAANNMAWKAMGLPLPSTSNCDYGSVPANKKATHGYDVLNRLTSTSYGDGSPAVSRTYTPDGLLATISSGGTAWTYSYNRRRLLERESMAYGGVAYNIQRTYDALGNQARLQYPDNMSIDYVPDALGQPTRVGNFATEVVHHPNGAIASFKYGNGVAHTMTQNRRGLPEYAIDSGILRDRYTYDGNGNVARIDDQQEHISTRTMSYDGLDRLKTVDAPAMWGKASYTYDALDNITSATLTAGATARATTMNYDAANRLASISGPSKYAFTYSYDSQGNVIKRGSQAFTFDLANRMKSASSKATYLYDGHGRRTSVVDTVGTNTVSLYSLDGQLLFQKNTQASTGWKHVYLHRHLIALHRGASTQYQFTDALGSPVARKDDTALSRTRYEPYGLVASGLEHWVGFTGHLSDQSTGLVYMQQRYFDPVGGRFLGLDPKVAHIEAGNNFNRYAYANNSPYKYIDPDGRFANFAVGFVIGAGIEAALQLAQSGKITSGAAIIGSGTAGALSGGVSGVLAASAARGATSAVVATAKTALAGGASAVVGKATEGVVAEKMPSTKDFAYAAAGGVVGGLVGGQLSNAPIAALEREAAKSGLAGHVGTTTINAVQKGGQAAVTTSTATEVVKVNVDANIAIIDKTRK